MCRAQVTPVRVLAGAIVRRGDRAYRGGDVLTVSVEDARRLVARGVARRART